MEQPEAQLAADTSRQATAADLRAELGSHDLPRHLALFYRSDESQLAATTAFFVEGLQSGHRCAYLFDANTVADIKSALRRANTDVEQRIDTGDLVIRDAEEVYLESGFDPNKMITRLETEANASVEDGYDGLWLAGENSWCFHTERSFDHILDFEADFDAACPDLPVTALCQYDLDRFNGTSAAKALQTHEQVIYRNLGVLTKVYRKFLVKAVDDKIKQVLFLYLAVRFGLLHIFPKQTLPLTRCDRLRPTRSTE